MDKVLLPIIPGAAATAVFDALASGIVVFNPAWRVCFVNRRGGEILRAAPGALASKAFNDLFPRTAAADVEAALEAHESFRGESPPPADHGHNGRMLGYTVTRTSALDLADGCALHYIVFFQDITEWARIRQERDRLMKLAAVSATMPTVLHELKNPLAAIKTSVELLLEEMPDGQARDDVYSILGEVRRMGLVLDGISVIGNQLRSKRHGAVDFALREAFQVLTAKGVSLGIKMEVRVHDMPLLPFDPNVIRAITFNLVKNAIDVCRAGDTITLEGAFDGATLTLAVRDTGPGMGPETLARATELFFSTKASGSGIGLALCNEAVTQAGGKLAIASEPGKGTEVRVTIPLNEPAAKAKEG